jgi:hypothetical protein
VKNMKGYKLHTIYFRKPEALRAKDELQYSGFSVKIKTKKGYHGNSYEVWKKQKSKPYAIQIVQNGGWKTVEKHGDRKYAVTAFGDFTRGWNKVRLKKNGKIIKEYNYKKPKY